MAGQYNDDFGSYAVGVGVPSGWTSRWLDINTTREIIAKTGTSSGKAFRIVDTTNIHSHLLSLNAVDGDADRADAEVLLKINGVDAAGHLGCAIIRAGAIFGQGYTVGFSTAIQVGAHSGVVGLTINTHLGGLASFQPREGHPAFPMINHGTWWIRFRVQQDQIKAKIWSAGREEQAGWDIEITDTTYTNPGWIGWATDTSSPSPSSPTTADMEFFSVCTLPTGSGGTAAGDSYQSPVPATPAPTPTPTPAPTPTPVPAAPTINTIKDSLGVVVPDGTTTENTQPHLYGTGAPANGLVSVYANGYFENTVSADNAGAWDWVKFGSYIPNTYSFVARARNEYLLQSVDSTVYEIEIIPTPTPTPTPPPPTPPVLLPPTPTPPPITIPPSVEVGAVQAALIIPLTAAVSVDLSQLSILAPASFAAEAAEASQISIMAPTDASMDIEVSQTQVLAVVYPGPTDPKIRVWTFTLDDHNFYGMKLGMLETLVYDDTTGQWAQWGTADSPLWRANDIINWLGAAALPNIYGSNIVACDRATGAIYFLDPDSDTDDSFAGTKKIDFLRSVTGQVVKKQGYGYSACNEVQLLGSIGQNYQVAGVTLYTSDNRGQSYDNRGSINVALGAYDDRLSWRSIGSFPAPGRLFRVQDYGALKRVDSMEMMGDE